MQRDTAMTLRLNHNTTTLLRESAAKNHRSLAAEIRFALDKHLSDTTTPPNVVTATPSRDELADIDWDSIDSPD
jgi:plasmid stability protein